MNQEHSMAAVEKRTVSLPAEQASYIDALVASGAFASASEVVRAGLRALQERDAAVERWLRVEVAEAYDELQRTPEAVIPADDVAAALRKRHADQVKAERAA
jgi:antitoxin ParD1/3/4